MIDGYYYAAALLSVRRVVVNTRLRLHNDVRLVGVRLSALGLSILIASCGGSTNSGAPVDSVPSTVRTVGDTTFVVYTSPGADTLYAHSVGIVAEADSGRTVADFTVDPNGTVTMTLSGIAASTSSADDSDEGWLPPWASALCEQTPDEHFATPTLPDFRARYLALPTQTRSGAPIGAFGCATDYTVQLIDRSGRRIEVHLEGERLRPSVRELDSFTRAWTAQRNNDGSGRRWDWEGEPLPNERPAYLRLLNDTSGRVWVWPTQPAVAMASPRDWSLAGLPDSLWTEPPTGTFDVFSGDGSRLRHVKMPADFVFTPFGPLPDPVVRGDTIWAVTRQDGRQGVARFEIASP